MLSPPAEIVTRVNNSVALIIRVKDPIAKLQMRRRPRRGRHAQRHSGRFPIFEICQAVRHLWHPASVNFFFKKKVKIFIIMQPRG